MHKLEEPQTCQATGENMKMRKAVMLHGVRSYANP